jgi:hypothetical protein
MMPLTLTSNPQAVTKFADLARPEPEPLRLSHIYLLANNIKNSINASVMCRR